MKIYYTKNFNIDNKQGMQGSLFIHAHVTLEYFNFERENRFKRFVVYFYCFSDNCCQAIAGRNGTDPHPSFVTIMSMTHSISERIPKICSLIPYLKCFGDLVWCMLGCMLTLCKRIVTHRPQLHQTIVVTCRQVVYQRNFAGSQTLPSLNSFIHYYTLHYWNICITSKHA